VHDYDAEVDDLSRDGQTKNAARLHKALDEFTAIDPATLSAGDRDDREMLINASKGSFWTRDDKVLAEGPKRLRAQRDLAVFDLVHRILRRLRSLAVGHRPRGSDSNATREGKANIEHHRGHSLTSHPQCRGLDRFPEDWRPAAFAGVEDQELKRDFTASNDSRLLPSKL